jgi:dolichyl-phosphate-mannose-protein mannosyltransferase
LDYSHYLPTLYFSVLLLVFLLDHFFFTRRRVTVRGKSIVFTLVAGTVVGTSWWMRSCAFGIDGRLDSMWGLRWRRVSPRVVRARECCESLLTRPPLL